VEQLYPVAIYWLNGLLALLYWLGEHWAALAALVVALLSARLLDAPQAQLAGARPRRYDRGQTQAAPPTLDLPVALLGLVWTVVAWITPAPVPYIGLAMWLTALGANLALPLGKRYLIHRLRWFIGLYAALVLGFWAIVRTPLSPAQAAAWSEKLRAVGAGEALEEALRSQFVPYLALLIWAILPLTYFGYVAQQLATQRRLLVSPWTSVQQRIADLRGRGEA
jgi:hypothetical protein